MGGKDRSIQGFGGETLMERGYLEHPGVDGRIILSWIFRKWDLKAWRGSIVSG